MPKTIALEYCSYFLKDIRATIPHKIYAVSSVKLAPLDCKKKLNNVTGNKITIKNNIGIRSKLNLKTFFEFGMENKIQATDKETNKISKGPTLAPPLSCVKEIAKMHAP